MGGRVAERFLQFLESLDLTFLVFGSDSEGWVLERPHYSVLCVSDACAYSECRYSHFFVKLGP